MEKTWYASFCTTLALEHLWERPEETVAFLRDASVI